MNERKLHVDIWSDIACPWCYVGKRRFESALQRFAHREAVDVVWRAFELDPKAPRRHDAGLSYAERLGRKYGTSARQAELMIARMTEVARQDGLDFRFDRIQSGNTFDAHRLLHLAHERGVQDAVKERFLLGYMTEGEAIGEPEVLERLAREAGLSGEDARQVLAGSMYAEEVRREEARAHALGISSVPCFVFDERLAVSGAQPAEQLLAVLERVWGETATQELESTQQGAVCGVDGCST